jgi:uncharacterized protein (DUF1501 family)
VALQAFSAGVCASAHLALNGFDTHSAHDIAQPLALGRLSLVLSYVFSQLETLGLSQRTYLLSTSDFGRTPTYADDAGNGKGHWPTSSMLVSGPGIVGGRTIGSSTADFLPLAVNAADPSKTDVNGEYMTPAHVVFELRRHLGMVGAAVDQQFPIYLPKPVRMWD